MDWKKIFVILALVIAVGHANGVGFNCINTQMFMDNFSLNGIQENVTGTCDYGCDTVNNRCYTIDAGYAFLASMAIIIFTVLMFWLAHNYKAREEGDEFETTKVGMHLIFLILGMLGLLGLLWYVGGIVTGYTSSFLTGSAQMINGLADVWGIFIGIFILITVIFFMMGVVRNYLIRREKRW